jgi:hypothetical protein
MRLLTRRLPGWSTPSIVVGDDGKLQFPGEPRRKGTPKFVLLQAPLDACFRPEALRVEVHLLDLLTGAGVAPTVGFFLDSGGQ